MISAHNSIPSLKAFPVGARGPDRGRITPIFISFGAAFAVGATRDMTTTSAKQIIHNIDHLILILETPPSKFEKTCQKIPLLTPFLR
jgi:hypothetical protein